MSPEKKKFFLGKIIWKYYLFPQIMCMVVKTFSNFWSLFKICWIYFSLKKYWSKWVNLFFFFLKSVKINNWNDFWKDSENVYLQNKGGKKYTTAIYRNINGKGTLNSKQFLRNWSIMWRHCFVCMSVSLHHSAGGLY